MKILSIFTLLSVLYSCTSMTPKIDGDFRSPASEARCDINYYHQPTFTYDRKIPTRFTEKVSISAKTECGGEYKRVGDAADLAQRRCLESGLEDCTRTEWKMSDALFGQATCTITYEGYTYYNKRYFTKEELDEAKERYACDKILNCSRDWNYHKGDLDFVIRMEALHKERCEKIKEDPNILR